MAKILIIFSTTDGHTKTICQRLKQVIEQYPHDVTVIAIEDVKADELQSFEKIIIGASIRYGKHSPKVYNFVKRNQAILDAKSNAFFSVNAVARKPEKSRPETNPYLKKFLTQIKWQPKQLAVFGGKIDYPKYNVWDKQIIRMIMWMTNGPTDPNATVEFTDWNKVEAFGRMLIEEFN